MKIEKIKGPELSDIKMNCDNILHKKLLEYEMIADCFSKNNFTVILGKMGSGKTTLMLKLLKDVVNKVYENVYVIMPELSRRSIDHDILSKELPADSLFDDLTVDNLNEILDKVKENSKHKENSLVIIDDYQERFKDKKIALVMEQFIIRLRHLHCSIWLLQQNYFKLPKNSRQLISNLIFYNIGKSQLEQIFEDICILNKKEYEELIRSFVDPHDFFVLNLKTNNIYKGFDKKITFDSYLDYVLK
jgi:hypothetical protein